MTDDTDIPPELDIIDLATVWLTVQQITHTLVDELSDEPDPAARRKLVRAALQRVRHEIEVDTSRETQRILPLLVLAEMVL
jgi:hypothetical protein